MIRAAALMVCASGLYASIEPPDIKLYESVLVKYVKEDGRVDYAGLRSGPTALDRFVSQIASVCPDNAPKLFPSKQDRLAYWINCYNALVLQAFSHEYPEKKDRLKTVLGKTQFFYRMKHKVGGMERTLADIEDKSIRSMGDPRIHFAIVCASKGCPWLSRTAYTSANVDSQLEQETKRYFSQPRNFRFDVQRHEVWLPAIFDWFKADFGGTRDAVLRFVARYRPAEATILRNGGNHIRYFAYDWSPNDIR